MEFLVMEEVKQEMLNHAMEGNWEDVVGMYEKYPWAQNARLTRSGETALHIAVFESTEDTVKRLVNLVDAEEEKAQHGESSSAAEAKNPLMIANDRGNTPLHLAALIGNVNMCEYIATKREELVGLRNIAGETPLFLAALRGKREAFLYLHSKCGPAGTHNHYTRRDDGQTILHVAISGEYFDVAYHIICKYDHLIYCVDENGYTPLHVLASKPAVFKTSLHLAQFSRFIYNCLHVDELTNEPVPNSSSMPTFKGKEKPEKHPEKYKRCINFFQPLLKMLQNMIKRPGHIARLTFSSLENLPTSRKHMETNKANMEEDLKQRRGDTAQNQGKRSCDIKLMIRKFISRSAMLFIRGLVRLFGSRELKKMRAKKEKNVWSLEIMKLLLQKSSSHTYDSSGGCNPGPFSMPNKSPLLTYHTSTARHPEPFSIPMEKDQMDCFSNPDSTNQRRETPILLATKNGITEMVMGILKLSPTAILDRDSANKNIVHLAVENRRTKLYEKLAKKISIYEGAFRAVDNRGNSVLHLAATLGDHRSFPFATLQMQWEIKWYKYVKDSVPRDFFISRNNENRTAKEMFRKSHKVLVKGGKWLIRTSNSCSVVATVVTTVAFATTATIPGGMKEDSSTPNLEHDPGFIVFAISSLIALSFSITSVIAFLAILTPRHSPKDFERQLPKKLLYALTFLFISLAAMLVSFCAGHFFLVRDDLHGKAFLVYGVVCLPVAYFAMKQFPFCIDLVLDTFRTVPRHMPS